MCKTFDISHVCLGGGYIREGDTEFRSKYTEEIQERYNFIQEVYMKQTNGACNR